MDTTEDSETTETTNKRRRLWTHKETKALLDTYKRHKDEFRNPRKKKFAWKNVAEDLCNGNWMASPVDDAMCHNKFKSMIRAYKKAMDKQNGYVRTLCVPFEKELDELLRTGAIALHSKKTNKLPEKPTSPIPSDLDDESEASTSRDTRNNKRKRAYEYIERKLTLKEAYYNKKLQLIEQANEDKERRHQEKMVVYNKLSKAIDFLTFN